MWRHWKCWINYRCLTIFNCDPWKAFARYRVFYLCKLQVFHWTNPKGHGTCECGECKCSETEEGQYSGKFCEDCPVCIFFFFGPSIITSQRDKSGRGQTYLNTRDVIYGRPFSLVSLGFRVSGARALGVCKHCQKVNEGRKIKWFLLIYQFLISLIFSWGGLQAIQFRSVMVHKEKWRTLILNSCVIIQSYNRKFLVLLKYKLSMKSHYLSN